MKVPPVPGWKATISKQPVFIPNATRDAIAETIMTEVPAWEDPQTGKIYLDGEAHEMLDAVKARHLGILLPDQLRAMRKAIGLTQKKMAELLQLGEKTWTRWETGAERPSRSMNVLLCALRDGKIDLGYLQSKRRMATLGLPTVGSEPAAQAEKGVAESSARYGTMAE